MAWRRFDTLFVRLFLLIWVTLVLSHLLAYALVIPLHEGDRPIGEAALERLHPSRVPVLPSLPPGSPFERADGRPPGAPRVGPPPDRSGPSPYGPAGPPGAPPPDAPPDAPAGGSPALPSRVLWLDYGLRLLGISLGAWLGARWLSTPMRRLSAAAQMLTHELPRGVPPPQLDTRHGTREVREAAQVFNRMAERLREQFEARGLQLAALSHDLRTPLTRLRLRLQALPEAPRDAATRDIVEIDEMLDGTLAVLREQQGGSAPQPIEPAALLQALADDLAEYGQVVALDLAPGLRALARPAALRRIVGNLVGNALRYGGSACITLRACGEGIEILVDDDGPGIPAAELERVFQPWVRLAHQVGGHGLGLAIARDLAERDGATLSLTNRAGGGLRARLVLPADKTA